MTSIYVPYSKLPEFEGATGNYKVRFRINSVDKTKNSAWTPYYEVSVLPVVQGVGDISFNSTAQDGLNLSWTDPNGFGSYDIFTYDHHDGATTPSWKYITSVTTRFWASPINTNNPNENNFGVVVQAPTFPKTIWYNNTDLYKYAVFVYGNVAPPVTL